MYAKINQIPANSALVEVDADAEACNNPSHCTWVLLWHVSLQDTICYVEILTNESCQHWALLPNRFSQQQFHSQETCKSTQVQFVTKLSIYLSYFVTW